MIFQSYQDDDMIMKGCAMETPLLLERFLPQAQLEDGKPALNQMSYWGSDALELSKTS